MRGCLPHAESGRATQHYACRSRREVIWRNREANLSAPKPAWLWSPSEATWSAADLATLVGQVLRRSSKSCHQPKCHISGHQQPTFCACAATCRLQPSGKPDQVVDAAVETRGRQPNHECEGNSTGNVLMKATLAATKKRATSEFNSGANDSLRTRLQKPC